MTDSSSFIGEIPSRSTTQNSQPTPETRPWVRFFARLIDISLYYVFFLLILPSLSVAYAFMKLTLTLHNIPQVLLLSFLIWTTTSLVMNILLESILLSSLGTTLGKWLLKITVRDQENKKLTFRTALKRTFLVYYKGLALYIPFINIFTLITAYKVLKEIGSTSWDRDCKTTVSHQKIGFFRTFIAIVLFISLQQAYTLLSAKSLELLCPNGVCPMPPQTTAPHASQDAATRISSPFS